MGGKLLKFRVSDLQRYVEGLPEDACLIGSYSYQESATGYLMFSHESFAEVPLGEIIPTFTPKHEQYFVEKGEDDE